MWTWTVGLALLAAGVAGPVERLPAQVERVAATSIDERFAAPGPSAVTVEALDAAHTVYRPTDLGEPGTLHPVIIWGNGTGSPKLYDRLLRHWASHGFVVAAANTPSRDGAGDAGRAARLISENDRPGAATTSGSTPPTSGRAGIHRAAAARSWRVAITRVDDRADRAGSARLDHDAARTDARPRREVDLVVPPPVLIIPRYDQADHMVAVYGELAGAGHTTPAGDGGGFRGASTAWFLHWLSDDAAAGATFFGAGCVLCSDPAWSGVRRNARAEAVPAPSVQT